jgi:hypothetical protein
MIRRDSSSNSSFSIVPVLTTCALCVLVSCAAPPTSTSTPATANSAVPTSALQSSPSPEPLPSPSMSGTPPATPTSAAPTPAASTSTPTGNVGYLEGRASIGPLTPVERVGVPSPTPSPQMCTARGLTIYSANGQTQVTSFNLQPDCTYRVALPPGQYVVRLRSGQFGFSKGLPKTVQIESGKTVRLDFHIDTGIR